MPEPSPAIELKGVGRDFGERPALEGVDIELPAGGTLAVLGPNGSGKTTLLRMLAGLLRPTRGDARVLGCKLPGQVWRLRGRIGFLSHRPLLYRDLTPRENLVLSARLNGIWSEPAKDRMVDLLDRVGMLGRADDKVAELSAGMAQRVAACMAVLHEPELLLLDEPDSHLDVAAREAVASVLAASPDRTRVIVSHDRDRALGQADMALEL